MPPIEQFYQFVVRVVPDWLMAGLMFTAVLVCSRRYRLHHNRAILALIIPLIAFTGFYLWGVIFEPLPLARLAIGRAVSLGLAIGIIAWGLLTNEKNE